MQSATRSVDKKNLQSIRKQNAKMQKNKTTANKCLPWFLHQKCLKKRKSNKNY